MDLFGEFFKGKRVFVTGDTGFKGSWLCIWLNELGAEVHGYALPPRTAGDNFNKAGIGTLIHHMDGDIRDAGKLNAAFRDAKPEIAFHLAAQSLVLPSYESPAETFETNILGAVNFFEAVRQSDSVKVAINVTSDKCYQNNEWVWGYRESDPMGGNDPYSASKGCSELITNSYAQSFFKSGDCLIASARAGNVIGGGDWAPLRIIPDIFRAYFSREDLIVRNPYATRPWQFVLEPLFGYLKLAQTLWKDGRAFTGGWNFGPAGLRDYTVQDTIQAMRKIIPELKYKLDPGDKPRHEAKLLKLDISKALTHLAWRPLLDFEQTIDFTVRGYLAERSSDNIYKARKAQIAEYTSRY